VLLKITRRRRIFQSKEVSIKAGFGVSPKNLFFSFCSPPQAASKKKLEATPNPGRETPAPFQLSTKEEAVMH